MTELSPAEVQLKVTEHLAEWLGKLVQEDDKEACLSFAESVIDSLTLKTGSMNSDGEITATLKLVDIDVLLAEFLG